MFYNDFGLSIDQVDKDADDRASIALVLFGNGQSKIKDEFFFFYGKLICLGIYQTMKIKKLLADCRFI